MIQLSIINISFIVLILCLIAYAYKRIIRPYVQYSFYKTILCSNYKTLVLPFDILGTKIFKRWQNDLEKYNDSHYTVKTQYPKYEVVLANHKGQVFIQLLSTKLVQEFYERVSDGYYQKDPESLSIQSISSMLGKGILFSEGSQWKHKRKIMSQLFNFEFIKSKISTIVDITTQQLNKAEKQQNSNNQTVKFDLNRIYQKIFGTVVVKCFFGDVDLQKIEGVNIFDFVSNLMVKNTKRLVTMYAFFFGMPIINLGIRKVDRQMKINVKKFRQYAIKVVGDQVKKIKGQSKDDIKKQKENNGVIRLLLKEQKLKQEPQGKAEKVKDYYTFADLVDEFGVFFLAGTDTTSNMMTFLTYLIAQHLDIQEKIRKQIEEVIGDDVKNITYQNLKKMNYLDNVQKQTLRMYSPNAGIFLRRATKDHFIGNIPIKKGMAVNIKIKTMHYRETVYPQPMKFDPERWEKIDMNKMEPFTYLPFSSGQRNCIGQHLSFIEGKVALILILQRYKRIELQKLNYKKMQKILYGPEQMTTKFYKKFIEN